MRAIIMAGGKGTRITSVKSDVPKPMIEICGKPILEYEIKNLKACGLTDITLVVGHLGHIIKDYFGDGSQMGVKISYFIESQPLGTAGALFKMLEENPDESHTAWTRIDSDFILLSGDIIIDVDFNRFIRFHEENKAWASLMSHPNGHPYDSSLLMTEILPPQEKGGLPVDTHKVVRWMNKEDDRLYYRNRVNAGIEIISPLLLNKVLNDYKERDMAVPEKVDLDRDVLKLQIPSGKIFAYDTPEYVKDMGTPDRFYETVSDIKSGKVRARNLKNKQRAIFLDRDGTITMYKNFITKAEDLELVEGAAETIKAINKSGYLVVIVTNQPVIARGECTFEELRRIHGKMETDLGKSGAFVDAIYYCPHHPDKGFEGERLEYKIDCNCRKPKTGLFLRAAKDLNIDLTESIMVGDSERDIQAGKNAGLKDSILIERNKGIKDVLKLIDNN